MGIESLLIGGQAAGAGLSAIGAYDSSKGAQAAYNAQAQVSQNNAQIAGWQAEDAVARGGKAATGSRVRTLQLEGDQRAAFGSNGVDMGEGSAQNIQQDTSYFGKIDANQLIDNASREAWGYRTQQTNFANNAAMLRSRAAAESPLTAGFTSLLGSATRVAGSWYGVNKATSGTGADPLGTFMRSRSGSGG
jgi:hypothetical protein